MTQTVPTDAEATAYAENYTLYGNQSRAFRAAFPDSRAAQETIHVKASIFHAINKVQIRVSEVADQIAKQAKEEFKLDIHYVAKRLAEIDQMDAADIISDNGTVLPIKQWPKVWRQYISGFDIMEVAAGGDRAEAVIKKIKWPDKTKNLEMIGKLASVGAFKERTELTGPNGGPLQSVTLDPKEYADIRKKMIDNDDC